jgi:predicted aminopeptidase
VLAVVFGLALLTVAGTATGRYLVRAAWEQGRILRARRPIARVIADPATDDATRDKLHLVEAARAFASESLGLRTGKSFRQYADVGRDTLVLVLSAAYRDSLAFRTRWWPVVGRVPYQGYFAPAAARRDSVRLTADGYDVYLRPATAFSTLGWFADPVMASTLRADSTALVNTVIHELVHQTTWIKGQAEFNESFANAVGYAGARRFFARRGDTAAVAAIAVAWRQERLLGAFWHALYARLDTAFRAHPGPANRAARLAVRDSLFAAARVALRDSLGPRVLDDSAAVARWAEALPLTIAAVLSRRVYRTGIDDFAALFDGDTVDLRATIARVVRVSEAAPRDPLRAVFPPRP